MDSNKYEMKQYNINNKLSMLEYYFNDEFDSITKRKYDYKGNICIWSKILNNYYLNENIICMRNFNIKNKYIVIYGAGKRCEYLLFKFHKYGIKVNGIAVSNREHNPNEVFNVCVNEIERYPRDSMVIISVEEYTDIKKLLVKKGYCKLAILNKFYEIEEINTLDID